ncbi:unnamed protein product [Paramecium octaurelia]|uniref:Transmembrane protein n=1 Tax=Paramecium octaurelia TaxID=43137 RepID=A0A8S1W3I5_PAROT|nr:unnamed protein product [Paramecium octaurelia]
MGIIFILLVCLQIHLNSSKLPCQDQQFQPFFSCYQQISSCYFLEGDDEDYSKIQHIDNQIIKPSFIISCEEDPIFIKIIDSLDQNKKIQEKLLCSLFRNLEYFIVCTSFDLVQNEDQITTNEKFRFGTKIASTENCDEMDINEDGGLNLFCLSQSTLKQYSLNLSSRNTTLILEIDFQDQLLDNCKLKYYQWKQNVYIVVFYHCSSWKVLLFNKSEMKTLLEASKKDKIIQIQTLSFINDVTFCKSIEKMLFIYLIENNFYLEIKVNGELKYLLFQHTKRIHKLLLQTKCSITVLVDSLEDINQNISHSTIIRQINLNLTNPNHNIYFNSDILYLQQESELTVFLNLYINQTYQIGKTQLHFFQFDNIFCQFDQSKNGLQFYRYYKFSSLIKPKKKYLFLVFSWKLFQKNAVQNCFRLLKNNATKEEKLVKLITLHKICQSNFQSIIFKSEPQTLFKNSSFTISNNKSSINVSIRINNKFLDSCLQMPKLFHIQGNVEFLKINLPDYIVFQNKTNFYIFNCTQNKILISVNRVKFDVLESDENYYIVEKNNNSHFLRIIQLNPNSEFQLNIKFDEAIIRAEQIAQNVFIYLNNSNQLPIIYQNYVSDSYRKYLQKSLQSSEPILFYFESQNLKVIQYPNVIAVEDSGYVACFNFLEDQIISIQIQSSINKDCLIVAIQIITRSLTLNYFNDHYIHQISNYTFSDYQFSYPFVYKLNFQHLAILMKRNQEFYIALFQFNISFLYLQDIIATDSTYFTFSQSNLLYSSNKQWMFRFTNYFQIDIESDDKFSTELSQFYQTDLYPGKKEQQSIQLNILIYNLCYKLYPFRDLFRFEIQQNEILKLNISDIFLGPINSLSLVSSSSLVLNGPFQFIRKLEYCSLNTSSFCIQKYNIKSQTQEHTFKAIIMNNQVYEIINNHPNEMNNYIIFINQSYYLWFSQFSQNLQIQLIQCSGLIDEYCNVISDINEKLQIKSIVGENVMRTGNLIKLQITLKQIFIYFEDINFIEVPITGKILDVRFIEGQKDQSQYLFLQQKDKNSSEVELIIYSINLNHYSLLYYLSISKELQIELSKFRQQGFKFLKLVSCIQVANLTKIKLFMRNQHFTYLYYLMLDRQNNQIQLESQKSIRNWGTFDFGIDQFTLDYFDENILVLKELKDKQFQYYDLREEKSFYDYFHKSMNQIITKRINTTHFIFFHNSIFHLGTIGYQIEQQNLSQSNYNIELYASNDISEEKALFQILLITSKNQFTILLIQLLCLIFIIFYLRNMKTSNQNQNKRCSNLQVTQFRNI